MKFIMGKRLIEIAEETPVTAAPLAPSVESTPIVRQAVNVTGNVRHRTVRIYSRIRVRPMWIAVVFVTRAVSLANDVS